jgi:hypothetical protein
MTNTITWPRITLAVLTVLTLALLLYTIGAPSQMS